jgi:hypothetical protein
MRKRPSGSFAEALRLDNTEPSQKEIQAVRPASLSQGELDRVDETNYCYVHVNLLRPSKISFSGLAL